MSLAQAAKIINGEPFGDNVKFSGVSTDTRTIAAGELFVALTGENFNGHEFISIAQEKGAVATLISEDIDSNLPSIKVENTLNGLQRLAASWRGQFEIPVIAVTGSNGKTTVKELIGAILKSHYQDVLITKGNLNNHIGVPLTLLELNNHHQSAVVEMGMNHVGEVSLLAQLTRPTIALINNAMFAHVEAFDSVEAVARTKAEIFDGLSEDGIAILNADDENFPLWKKLIGQRKYINFGLSSGSDITADIRYESEHVNLDIKTPKGSVECKLNLLGHHNAMNALAAVASTFTLDIDLAKLKQGLESVFPVRGRLEPISLGEGILLLNDTYNANPDSMKAGIDVLQRIPGQKKILVVGDMGELGRHGPELHKQIGEYAKCRNIDSFLSLGPLMSNAASAFGQVGFNTQQLDHLLEKLNNEITFDCVILVKGSRSMQMERIVQSLEMANRRGQV